MERDIPDSQESVKSVCDQTIDFDKEDSQSPDYGSQMGTPRREDTGIAISAGLDPETPATTPYQGTTRMEIEDDTTFFEADINEKGEVLASKKAIESEMSENLFAKSPETSFFKKPAKGPASKFFRKKNGSLNANQNVTSEPKPKTPIRKRGRQAKKSNQEPMESQNDFEIPAKRGRRGAYSKKSMRTNE